MSFEQMPIIVDAIDYKIDRLFKLIDEALQEKTPEYIENKKLNVKECAAYLNIAPVSVYRLVDENKIPYFRIANKILFTRQKLDAWVEELNVITNDEIAERVNAKLSSKKPLKPIKTK